MTQSDPPDRFSKAGTWHALDQTMAEARAGFTDLAPEAMEALAQEAVTSTRHARKASAMKAPYVGSRPAVTRKSLAASPATMVRSVEDADHLMALIQGSAARVHDWVAAQTGDPLDMLRRMKFDPVGFHPVEGRPLNLVEQINQTWTYAVAVAAARQLLLLHPDAGSFHLAPGAHMARELDIMSEVPGLVGAETFAAVHPRSNNKLSLDLMKLAARSETHRYVFFLSPPFPGTARRPSLERGGVQVWSVDV